MSEVTISPENIYDYLLEIQSRIDQMIKDSKKIEEIFRRVREKANGQYEEKPESWRFTFWFRKKLDK